MWTQSSCLLGDEEKQVTRPLIKENFRHGEGGLLFPTDFFETRKDNMFE